MKEKQQCINMISQQLKTGDVENVKILNLFKEIPREDFVPEEFKHFAYADLQIHLGNNQRMLTPLEEAQLLQSLNLTGNETVLEIGTGSGFLTACLCKLAKFVLSVEFFQDFTARALPILQKHNCDNLELITGDGVRGWLDKAPYDVVIFTGALEKLTDIQKLQVLPGGKLFAMIGKAPIMSGVLYSLDHENKWQEKLIFETNIPPLIDKYRTKEFVF